MTEICSTRFEIKIGDSEEAKFIYSEADRLVFKGENGSEKGGIKQLIAGTDLGDVIDYEPRGIVYLIGCDSDAVVIITHVECDPPVGIIPYAAILAFTQEHCPEAEVFYYAKAPSIGAFETNDPKYENLYAVNINHVLFFQTAEQACDRLADKYGKDSDVLKGFMDGCFNSDGTINCEKANAYLATVEEESDDPDSIHKWKVRNWILD